MTPFGRAVCVATGLDPIGLAENLRSAIDRGEAQAKVVSLGKALGIHPLSLALARGNSPFGPVERRQDCQALWTALGGNPTWLNAIHSGTLRLRGGSLLPIPADLVVDCLDIRDIDRFPDLPEGFHLRTLRIHHSRTLRAIPRVQGLVNLKLYQLPALKALPEGLTLSGLRIVCCDALEAIAGIRCQRLDIASCNQLRDLSGISGFQEADLYRLPRLEHWPSGVVPS